MRKILFEANTDFKGKMIRQRKQFMEHLLKAFSGDEDSSEEGKKGLMEYGVKIMSEREAGDDMSIRLNGEIIYKG